ncbi:tetratricopeptide repeat protein [Thalassobius sp. S69A]|uniref:tetratricopeptide repeat protein n=1 Tax=unclassified Thalassovita TaxID=2619711 RepID=UPI000C0DD135|nr:hypothetical protein [Paracoccaceae bacterium]MBT26884.1 hypothetical protein [Paracoccaceae bacterium]
MSAKKHNLKPIVAAIVLTVTFSLPLQAQESAKGAFPPDMLGALQHAPPDEAKRLAEEIALRWTQSGSAAMDLLVKRGQDALKRGEMTVALDHFTALTDHAPDFAEGWHLRASAFYQTQKFGMALHDLERALTLNPNHFQALYGLGVILEQLDRPKMALEAYELALAIYPHYDEANDAIARVRDLARGPEL